MTQSSISYVLLADGLFPSHPQALACLEKAHKIVCCDGASQKLLDFGKEPDYIVGDFDSISPEVRVRFHDRLVHSPDQETNDLTKGFRFCLGQDASNITILGATGLREDHTLGNISLLADYATYLPSIRMMTDFGIFIVVSDSKIIKSYPGQQISLFSIDPTQQITSYGLKYPLNNRPLTNWWQGTLNESLTDSFRLDISHGSLLIFQCY
ncbi:thiamine diphosphokinase [Microbacter margulisiae]|uniref:Thiamine diphosphokinase n=1 Tax=Microbacter margulisiae TaxID=1350067 RepID=A0A7W5H3E9_9PORP|nr:thiamine diphosphokinase [Microbacter margulisiae]MBB3188327.1 thiamine pyrophosphokinase [Microbacter margulisiae]